MDLARDGPGQRVVAMALQEEVAIGRDRVHGGAPRGEGPAARDGDGTGQGPEKMRPWLRRGGLVARSPAAGVCSAYGDARSCRCRTCPLPLDRESSNSPCQDSPVRAVS